MSNRRTNEIDRGILVEINGTLKPVLDDREYKRYLLTSSRWRLPRLIAAYAVNLPFSVEVREDGIRCVVSKHRLIGQIPSDSRQHVVWRHGYPLSTAVLRSKSVESVLQRGPRRERQSRSDWFRVLSSGGIYVANYRDFDLGNLGLPDWDAYVVDFAPERIRMNLARSTILDFKKSQAEVTKTWHSIKPQVVTLIREMTTSEEKEDYQSRTEALYDLLTTLPDEAKSLVAHSLLNSYQIVLFRFTKTGCEAWRSNLSEIAKSKVNQFILASENMDDQNLHFLLNEHQRIMEREMAFVIDCHFESAIQLADLPFKRKIQANPFEKKDGGKLAFPSYITPHTSESYYEAKNRLKTSVNVFLESVAAVQATSRWVAVNNTTVSHKLDQVRRALVATTTRNDRD